MAKVDFDKAYYIKLGKGGEWEEDSIENKKIRIGWKEIDLEDINNKRWKEVEEKNSEYFRDKGAAKRDFDTLKTICEADSKTILITFYALKLWWCKAKGEVKKDDTSKYREVDGEWSYQDVKGERVFWTFKISGKLAQLQMFPRTGCEVKEKDYLRCLINAEPIQEYISLLQAVKNKKENILAEVEAGLKLLHWRDFEILVDLIFRELGWRRISILGKGMKKFDLVLDKPETKDLCGVQIKSKASKKDFQEWVKNFSDREFDEFKKLYFVVHSPDESLRKYTNDYENVEIIFADKLAEKVVEGKLVDWLMEKIK